MALCKNEKHRKEIAKKMKSYKGCMLLNLWLLETIRRRNNLFKRPVLAPGKLLMEVCWWCLASLLPAMCRFMQGGIKTGTICS